VNRVLKLEEIAKLTKSSELHCKNWQIEGVLRMLYNVVNPEVAKDPENLIVYGGTGKAARNWECFQKIVDTLMELEIDETLLIQSGKPVAVFKTHEWATQGILQGTYETLAAVAKESFNGTLKGRLVLTAGLGEMGGAQPLAVTMNDGVAIDMTKQAIEEDQPRSIGLLGNAADVHQELAKRGIIPDVLTDQTAAHDPLNGYYPAGISKEAADKLRENNPAEYTKRAKESMRIQVKAMIEMMHKGAITFEYGNNLRQQAKDAGLEDAFAFPGFVQRYIRPMFCEGQGPFRWTSLVSNPDDIYTLDDVILDVFSYNDGLCRWIRKAKEQVKFQGLPARVCWLGFGERARFGKIMNEMVRKGQLSGPVWIGRDHLDGGSVASPNRETERMIDGSDAIADWPILNALLNAVAGATWVSVHHGGGVGIGYSIHAGMCLVADGTEEAEKRIVRVLTTDPGTAIVRHADAGYERAKKIAKAKGIKMPMLK